MGYNCKWEMIKMMKHMETVRESKVCCFESGVDNEPSRIFMPYFQSVMGVFSSTCLRCMHDPADDIEMPLCPLLWNERNVEQICLIIIK